MVHKIELNLMSLNLKYYNSNFFQILSRVSRDHFGNLKSGNLKLSVPDFDELIMKRDYTGARTLLEVS